MADLLQYFQDAASKINSLNQNSCQMAQGLVSATASAITDATAQSTAQGTNSSTNLFSDAGDALNQWHTSEMAKINSRNAASALDPAINAKLNPGNIVYKALQKSNVPSEMYPLMMGLVGTIVVLPPGVGTNNAPNAQNALWVYAPPTGMTFKDFIGDPAVKTTTGLFGYDCGVDPLCLTPQKVAMNVESLSFDVQATVLTGMNNILNRTAQTFSQSDLNLYTNTTIPLYKLARIAVANNNLSMASSYSEVIAIELAYQWMTDALRGLSAVLAGNATNAQSPDVVEATKGLTTSIENQMRLATAQYQAAYTKVTTEAALQVNLKRINDEMMNAISPRIQSSLHKFSR